MDGRMTKRKWLLLRNPPAGRICNPAIPLAVGAIPLAVDAIPLAVDAIPLAVGL